MPWVRFDDQFTVHRKVRGLSDSAFRLHAEAIFWCARNLTDGFVPAEDLHVLATARRPLKFVPELVIRRSWHLADEACDSKKCPAHQDHQPDPTRDGWLLHDYFEYQPTKAKVLDERAKNAGRQKKWRDQHQELEPDSERNGVSNGVTPGVSSGTPSRPVPSRRDEVLHGAELSGISQSAGAREANRWLHQRYGLTDQESARVISEVHRRSAEPIKNLTRYLDRMAEGDLADIVAAVMDASAPPAKPEPPPPVQPPLLQAVPDLPGRPRATDPNAAFLEAKAAINRRKRGAS